MLFGNRRVEEELERIKKANLPETFDAGEVIDMEDDADDTEKNVYVYSEEPVDSVEIGFTAKDVLAMIIAAFSIIIPYALLFIGLAIVFVYFFFR